VKADAVVDSSDTFFGWASHDNTTPPAMRRVRVVLDNIASPAECSVFIRAAKTMISLGRFNSMPSMPEMVYMDYTGAASVVDDSDLQAMRRVRRLIRVEIVKHLRLKVPIYEDAYHFTRRVPGPPQDSHGLHADNCGYNWTSGNCDQRPEFCCAWRSYSAILFLNDGENENEAERFTGGEFFFAEDARGTSQSLITPKCGRLVAFSSGAENFHGVKHVDSGERFVTAIWYTNDIHRGFDHVEFSRRFEPEAEHEIPADELLLYQTNGISGTIVDL